ncbi:hypothetical protein F01_570013 [Burkholderia cenocepacia]|nr:hypothetical protein F01_570013 [Burkholderia cenocepacia]
MRIAVLPQIKYRRVSVLPPIYRIRATRHRIRQRDIDLDRCDCPSWALAFFSTAPSARKRTLMVGAYGMARTVPVISAKTREWSVEHVGQIYPVPLDRLRRCLVNRPEVGAPQVHRRGCLHRCAPWIPHGIDTCGPGSCRPPLLPLHSRLRGY